MLPCSAIILVYFPIFPENSPNCRVGKYGKYVSKHFSSGILGLTSSRKEMSIMRKNEKNSDPEKIETLEEIEADIAKILEGFNDFHEEIDLDDGSWGPLDPEVI